MATLSEYATFQTLFATARRRVVDFPGDIREQRLDLEGPPLRAHSRLLSSGALLFVQGENRASEDLVLRHEASAPIVAVHAPLRGTAAASMDGLRAVMTDRVGELQLFAAPISHSTVRLRAHVNNEAFRIVIAPSLIAALAERHPELELLARHVASGTPFCSRPLAALPLPRLLEQAAEIMNSEHYGALRPLFLESRALAWIALALSAVDEPGHKQPAPSEIERMHAARDLLLARIADPPTLAEVASAVGVNDFALKRNFKAVFGQPVHAYLLAVRLAYACRLLRGTADSVKQIAAAVGYAHSNHFSTAFRRAYGVSPAHFRANPHDSRITTRSLPRA